MRRSNSCQSPLCGLREPRRHKFYRPDEDPMTAKISLDAVRSELPKLLKPRGPLDKVVIATRGSKLALWQSNWVKRLLEAAHPEITVELLIMKTQGDIILDVPLAQVGGKGLFVKELEEALLDGRADLAVHSMKDVPTVLPEGLGITVMLPREDPRDAFLSVKYDSFAALPQGAKVGTSSLRRKAQLLAVRPDLHIFDLRGNVDTRIRKLEEGQYDAIILAHAGVRRLGVTQHVKGVLDPEVMLPAVAQGVVGIETRLNDEKLLAGIDFLHDEAATVAATAERALLRRLEGGCQVPIAAHATLEGGGLVLEGLVAGLDGKQILRKGKAGLPEDAQWLGTTLAEDLIAAGADKLLAELEGR